MLLAKLGCSLGDPHIEDKQFSSTNSPKLLGIRGSKDYKYKWFNLTFQMETKGSEGPKWLAYSKGQMLTFLSFSFHFGMFTLQFEDSL